MLKKKLSEVFGSQNAFVTVLGLFYTIVGFNDIRFDQTPEQVWDSLQGESFFMLVFFLANPIFKVVNKITAGTWDWSFLWKSANFKAQFFTVVALILSSFLDQELAGLIVAFLINVYNFVVHLAEKPKQTENA